MLFLMHWGKHGEEDRALEESEELYRSMIELYPDGIVAVDAQGTILVYNTAASRMSGYSKDEIVGKNFSKVGIFRAREIPKYLKIFNSCLIGKIPKPFDMTIYCKDGTTFSAEASVGLLKVGGKKIIQVTLRDITGSKRVEEELRESEERFRIASQIASDVVYERDVQTGIATFYGDIDSHLGYEPGGYPRTMEGWREHVHPEDLAWFDRQSIDQIEPGVPYSVEYRMSKKDGTYMTWWDRIIVIKDEKTGKPAKFIGAATDITERKQAEETLRESEAKFKSLAEQSPNMIFINKEGRIVYANDECERTTGYTKQEFYSPAFDFVNLIAPEFRDLIRANFNRHTKGEDVPPYEYALLTKDGKRIEVILSTALTEYEGSTATLGILTDITERKRMEEALLIANAGLQVANMELRRAQEQLVRSERLTAIGQLAGGVGHELRNPLGAIKNAAYYIRGKLAGSELAQREPRVMEFLSIMDDEINTANKIINDLLGFSRVGKPSVSPTQIKDVIEAALSHTTIPEGIELIKKLDAGLPQIEIDASQIQQVLVNIISNAVQAMPEEGKLIIGTREKEGFLEVEIADTGCGIPEETIDKIFDPLFTTRAKGIGLGLAVCKAIIDRHGGKIEVESQVGKETTFIIKLPLNRRYGDTLEQVIGK